MRFPLRGAPIACSLVFCLSATAFQGSDGTKPNKIDVLEDVLPKSVIEKLNKESKPGVLPGTALVGDLPVFFIVSSKLNDSKKLRLRIGRSEGRSPVALTGKQISALTADYRPGEAWIMKKLDTVARGFLAQIFQNATSYSSLQELVLKNPTGPNRFVLFCFDVNRLRPKVGSAGSTELEVDLSLRLFRVELGKKESKGVLRKVRSVTCLFQDHGVGTAVLPKGDGNADAVRDCLSVAAIDAIRNRIALSLLDNSRLATSWQDLKEVIPPTSKKAPAANEEGGQK